jgi:hypothetical protein
VINKWMTVRPTVTTKALIPNDMYQVIFGTGWPNLDDSRLINRMVGYKSN